VVRFGCFVLIGGSVWSGGLYCRGWVFAAGGWWLLIVGVVGVLA